MIFVEPSFDDAEIRTIAEQQEQYETVRAAIVRHPSYPVNNHLIDEGFNTYLVACLPTPEELARLNAGEPIYIGLLNFNHPMTPLLPVVGQGAAEAIWNAHGKGARYPGTEYPQSGVDRRRRRQE